MSNELLFIFFFYYSGDHQDLHSFPTRRSSDLGAERCLERSHERHLYAPQLNRLELQLPRSEEHTSELQSPCNLVCRLLLEKKNINTSKPAMGDLDRVEIPQASLSRLRAPILSQLRSLEPLIKTSKTHLVRHVPPV